MMFDRFNNNTFYTEATSQDNAYDAFLLTAVQNALAKNFSITKQQLDQNYQDFKKTNTVPAALVKVAKQTKQASSNQSMPEVNASSAPQTPVNQNPQTAAAKPKRAKNGQPIIRSDFKGPNFIYWNDIVTKVGKKPRYCSVTKDRRADEFKFTESSTPTMFVFYDFEKTQSETKMVIVPAPSLFNEDGSLKAPIPSLVLQVFATHGPGVPDWSSKDYKQFKVDEVKPITVVYDSQGRKIGGNLRHIGEGPTGTIEISQIQSNNAQAGQASGTPNTTAQPQTNTPQTPPTQAQQPAAAAQTQPQAQQPAQNATTPTNQLSADFEKGQPISETKIEMGLAQGILKPYLEHRKYDGTYLFTPSDKNSRFIGFINSNGQLMLFLNNAVLYRKDKPDPYWDNAGGIDELQASLSGDAKDTIFKDFSSAGGLILAQKPAVFEASDENKYVKMISAGEIKQAPNQNAESK